MRPLHTIALTGGARACFAIGRRLIATAPWPLRLVSLEGEPLDAAARALGAESMALDRVPPTVLPAASGGLDASLAILGWPDEPSPALARRAALQLVDRIGRGTDAPFVLVAASGGSHLVPLLARSLGSRVAGPGLWIDARLLAERVAARSAVRGRDVEVPFVGGAGRRVLLPQGIRIAGLPAGDLLPPGEEGRLLAASPRAPASERLAAAWVVRAARGLLDDVPDAIPAEISVAGHFGIRSGCATVHAMLQLGGAVPWGPALATYAEPVRREIVEAARESQND